MYQQFYTALSYAKPAADSVGPVPTFVTAPTPRAEGEWSGADSHALPFSCYGRAEFVQIIGRTRWARKEIMSRHLSPSKERIGVSFTYRELGAAD